MAELTSFKCYPVLDIILVLIICTYLVVAFYLTTAAIWRQLSKPTSLFLLTKPDIPEIETTGSNFKSLVSML